MQNCDLFKNRLDTRKRKRKVIVTFNKFSKEFLYKFIYFPQNGVELTFTNFLT